MRRKPKHPPVCFKKKRLKVDKLINLYIYVVCVCVRECMCVCVCVCQLYSIAKWLEHQPANLKAVGSMPGDTALVLLYSY